MDEQDAMVLSVLGGQVAAVVENTLLYRQQVETAQELRRLSQIKDNFLANMSHELRTPLNVIRGYSELILSEVRPKTDSFADLEISGLLGVEMDAEDEEIVVDVPHLVDQIEHIQESSARLLGLINDLLDISKIEAGRMSVEISEVNVRDMVWRVVSQAEALNRRGLEFAAKVGEDVGEVMWSDASKVEGILLNLVSNAMKFTEQGSVRLDVGRVGEKIQFVVTDTGIGIASEHQSVIFDAFKQVESGLSRRYGGTGLGLHLVWKLCQLLGGSVGVKSVVGEGSTFKVMLPIDSRVVTIQRL